MEKIFIDTDSFIALNDVSDALHHQAVIISEQLHEHSVALVTGTNILTEVATILSQRISHQKAIEFLHMARHGSLTILHPDKDLIFAAEELFIKQTSKNVSYCDCISFAIMKQHHISHVFSFDRDFKKNGFILVGDFAF